MFHDFKKVGDELVALIDPTKSVTLVAGFQTIIITWATIYILYIAYMSLLGKVDNPVRQVLYKLLMFMFISLFAFNGGIWYNYAIDAINGLVKWISLGGVDAIFVKLDDGLKMIAHISQVYEDNDSGIGKIKAALASVIIYFAYYCVALLVAIMLVINVVTLQIIIVLAPFAFLALFFPKINAIFDRWIELIISNVFTLFFVSLIFDAIYKKYASILTGLDPITTTVTGIIWDTTKVEIFQSAFSVLGFSTLAFMLILISIGVASKLSSVSIESLPKSAIMTTAAGAYIASKFIKEGVKGSFKAGKTGANASIKAVGGISRKAGNAGSKAHTLLKETGRKASAERRRGKK